jgi:hypothetical protein
MPPTTVFPALALAWALAGAEHAKITLDVSTPRAKETAFVDQTPPPSGKTPRPVLKAKVGEPIKVQWMFSNVYPHKTLQDVVLHFYVARQEKAGQADLPRVDEETLVVETAIEMDFLPGRKAGGRTTFKVDKPGAYLVRIESRQTQSDHEHFAAIDLVVEPD